MLQVFISKFIVVKNKAFCFFVCLFKEEGVGIKINRGGLL